jgi:acetolactate synthase-1/2/3 large subunit
VQYDAQLQSDIETVARNVSPWVRTSQSTAALCKRRRRGHCCVHGPAGQVATLILPADVSWGEGGVPAAPPKIIPPKPADDATVAAIAQALQAPAKRPFCWEAAPCALPR